MAIEDNLEILRALGGGLGGGLEGMGGALSPPASLQHALQRPERGATGPASNFPHQPPRQLVPAAQQPPRGRRDMTGPVTNMEDFANRVMHLESGGRLGAVSPSGNHFGLFQFSRDLLRRYGISNWQNADEQHRAFNLHVNDLSRQFQARFNRKPTAGELYLMHQQGVAGGMALIANPDAPAIQVISRFYRNPNIARRAIVDNLPGNHSGRRNPESLTAGQFANLWTSRFPRANQNYNTNTQPDNFTNTDQLLHLMQAPGPDRQPPNAPPPADRRMPPNPHAVNESPSTDNAYVPPGLEGASQPPPNAQLPDVNRQPPNVQTPPGTLQPPAGITLEDFGATNQPPNSQVQPPANQPPDRQPPSGPGNRLSREQLSRFDQPPDPAILEAHRRLNDLMIPLSERANISQQLQELSKLRWVDVFGGKALIDPTTGRAHDFQPSLQTAPFSGPGISMQEQYYIDSQGRRVNLDRAFPGNQNPPGDNHRTPFGMSRDLPDTGRIGDYLQFGLEADVTRRHIESLSNIRTTLANESTHLPGIVSTLRTLQTALERGNPPGGPLSQLSLQLRQLTTNFPWLAPLVDAERLSQNELSNRLSQVVAAMHNQSVAAPTGRLANILRVMPGMENTALGQRVIVDYLIQEMQHRINLSQRLNNLQPSQIGNMQGIIDQYYRDNPIILNIPAHGNNPARRFWTGNVQTPADATRIPSGVWFVDPRDGNLVQRR